MRRIGVLASGSGTILEAILAADLPVVVVVVDRDCRAVEIAEVAGLPVELVERKVVKDRVDFTHQVVDALQRHDVELVAIK